jgi:hypothetical protein
MKLRFRLGCEVDLPESEIRKILEGNSEPIKKALAEGTVKFEDQDSYVPGPWIEENMDLPKDIRDKYRDDVEIFI